MDGIRLSWYIPPVLPFDDNPLPWVELAMNNDETTSKLEENGGNH
jgi:hypothetical protein